MSASISWSKRADGVKIGFTQIAGLVARRILSFVREGDSVEAGQRVGMIRFGSRVDVYLPAGTGPRVLLGQRSIAGETILAEIGSRPGPPRHQPMTDSAPPDRGMAFRAMVPNAVTALALCFGLTGVRFGDRRRIGSWRSAAWSSPGSSTAWTAGSPGCCGPTAASARSSIGCPTSPPSASRRR